MTAVTDTPADALEIRSADSTSPRRARCWLARILKVAGVQRDTVDAALLAVSELVTNAVTHVGGRVLVCVEVTGGGVRLAVHDAGTRGTWQSPHEDMAEHGRGLAIVQALATDFTIATDQDGTTVTALIPHQN